MVDSLIPATWSPPLDVVHSISATDQFESVHYENHLGDNVINIDSIDRPDSNILLPVSDENINGDKSGFTLAHNEIGFSIDMPANLSLEPLPNTESAYTQAEIGTEVNVFDGGNGFELSRSENISNHASILELQTASTDLRVDEIEGSNYKNIDEKIENISIEPSNKESIIGELENSLSFLSSSSKNDEALLSSEIFLSTASIMKEEEEPAFANIVDQVLMDFKANESLLNETSDIDNFRAENFLAPNYREESVNNQATSGFPNIAEQSNNNGGEEISFSQLEMTHNEPEFINGEAVNCQNDLDSVASISSKKIKREKSSSRLNSSEDSVSPPKSLVKRMSITKIPRSEEPTDDQSVKLKSKIGYVSKTYNGVVKSKVIKDKEFQYDMIYDDSSSNLLIAGSVKDIEKVIEAEIRTDDESVKVQNADTSTYEDTNISEVRLPERWSTNAEPRKQSEKEFSSDFLMEVENKTLRPDISNHNLDSPELSSLEARAAMAWLIEDSQIDMTKKIPKEKKPVPVKRSTVPNLHVDTAVSKNHHSQNSLQKEKSMKSKASALSPVSTNSREKEKKPTKDLKKLVSKMLAPTPIVYVPPPPPPPPEKHVFLKRSKNSNPVPVSSVTKSDPSKRSRKPLSKTTPHVQDESTLAEVVKGGSIVNSDSKHVTISEPWLEIEKAQRNRLSTDSATSASKKHSLKQRLQNVTKIPQAISLEMQLQMKKEARQKALEYSKELAKIRRDKLPKSIEKRSKSSDKKIGTEKRFKSPDSKAHQGIIPSVSVDTEIKVSKALHDRVSSIKQRKRSGSAFARIERPSEDKEIHGGSLDVKVSRVFKPRARSVSPKPDMKSIYKFSPDSQTNFMNETNDAPVEIEDKTIDLKISRAIALEHSKELAKKRREMAKNESRYQDNRDSFDSKLASFVELKNQNPVVRPISPNNGSPTRRMRQGSVSSARTRSNSVGTSISGTWRFASPLNDPTLPRLPFDSETAANRAQALAESKLAAKKKLEERAKATEAERNNELALNAQRLAAKEKYKKMYVPDVVNFFAAPLSPVKTGPEELIVEEPEPEPVPLTPEEIEALKAEKERKFMESRANALQESRAAARSRFAATPRGKAALAKAEVAKQTALINKEIEESLIPRELTAEEREKIAEEATYGAVDAAFAASKLDEARALFEEIKSSRFIGKKSLYSIEQMLFDSRVKLNRGPTEELKNNEVRMLDSFSSSLNLLHQIEIATKQAEDSSRSISGSTTMIEAMEFVSQTSDSAECAFNGCNSLKSVAGEISRVVEAIQATEKSLRETYNVTAEYEMPQEEHPEEGNNLLQYDSTGITDFGVDSDVLGITEVSHKAIEQENLPEKLVLEQEPGSKQIPDTHNALASIEIPSEENLLISSEGVDTIIKDADAVQEYSEYSLSKSPGDEHVIIADNTIIERSLIQEGFISEVDLTEMSSVTSKDSVEGDERGATEKKLDDLLKSAINICDCIENIKQAALDSERLAMESAKAAEVIANISDDDDVKNEAIKSMDYAKLLVEEVGKICSINTRSKVTLGKCEVLNQNFLSTQTSDRLKVISDCDQLQCELSTLLEEAEASGDLCTELEQQALDSEARVFAIVS